MNNKRFNLASHWEYLGASFQNICLKEIPFKGLMVVTKGWNPTRKLILLEERKTRIRENQATIQAIEEQLNQTGPTLIPSGSQGVKQPNYPVGQVQDIFKPKKERVRTDDPEAVGLGERSEQEPEIVANNSGISSPKNRNITPTQNEHSVVTPDSNLNRDELWLKMSQFSELQESHERMKTLTVQEGHAQLRKGSEETNKRLDQFFEEQNHFKRDRDFLDQDLNKLFNVYQNMKPQPRGHVLDNLYNQEYIKPDAFLENKERYSSQYQDGENMYFYEKEALRQLPEASSKPKFFGTGEYDHMELIDYIDGLFIDVLSIPDSCITAR
ncbi:hypothetical protein O181_019544 [Austropuccinia psidii MF-1]|uniref:Uncharacterized protein n=1 Tax=Austropuccinia psidii MF-1 TaxID=1389203 RepID=A0A9Q3GUU5_9BASI|nr:hypothetical protein [Austropuccinia psidii MF-1]